MLSTTAPSLFGIGDINVNIRGVCLVLKLLRAIQQSTLFVYQYYMQLVWPIFFKTLHQFLSDIASYDYAIGNFVKAFFIFTIFPLVAKNRTKFSRVFQIIIWQFSFIGKVFQLLDRSPAFQTSDNFIRSYEIIRTKWPIH